MRHTRWRTSDRPILLTLLILLIVAPVFSQELEFSFAPEEIYLPLIIDGRYVGDINSLPADENTTEIDADELLVFLTDRVSEENLERLKEYPERWISMAELEDYPFNVSFNMADLMIEVAIPPENTQSRELSLMGTGDPLSYPEIEASELSFYVNVYSSLLLKGIDAFATEESETMAPLQTILYPSLNYKGWVFDTQITYSNQADGFTFGSFHLTRDWPDRPLKLLIGDLSYPTAELQSSAPYYGAVISKELSRSFERKTYSGYSRSLLVPENNALVSILLNDRRVKAVELEAGLYTVSDFYFNSGINDVAFIIEMAEETSAEEFLFAYDSSLMPPGTSEYSAGIGFRKGEGLSPELFGMQRMGITDSITAEGFFQAGLSQQNIGGSALTATTFGTFKLGTAISRTADASVGFFSSILWKYNRVTSRADRVYNLSASYTSPHYTSFSNTSSSATTSTPVSLSASYSQNLFDLASISTTGSFKLDTQGKVTTPTLSAALRTRLSRTLGVSMLFRGSWEDSGAFTPTTTVALSYNPQGKDDVSISYSQDLFEEGNTLAVSYGPEELKETTSFDLSLNDMTSSDPFPDQLSLGTTYKHRDFNLNGSLIIQRASTQVSYSTEFRFSSAFSYADGLFGISTPIADSFVLMDTKSEVDGFVLGVNRVGKDYKGRSDELGAAVVNGLSSFADHTITIEAIELPVGFEMGADKYTFRPTYRQGAVIKIGVDSNVTVTGRMLFSDGSPVALYSGEVTQLGQAAGEPNYFFTYTDGMYELYGLNSGEYDITLYIADGLSFRLTIPEGLTGELKAKDLIIPVSYKTF